jgi:hypothetical protein
MSEREGNQISERGRGREDEVLDELMRLLRADAEIMESVRDMIRVAADEAARRPSVLFQAPGGEESAEGEVGGQGVPISLLGSVGKVTGATVGGATGALGSVLG